MAKEHAKTKTLTSFDRIAGTYGFYQSKGLALVSEFEKMRVLLRISNLTNSNSSILEIGCGWGRCLSEVSASFLHRIGIDFSKQMLIAGKRKFPTLDFIRADMEHLPLRNSTINLVYSFRAFKWAPNPSSVLKEASRVSTKNGTVLIYETANSLNIYHLIWYWHDKTHEYSMATPFSTVKLLEAAGFHNVSYECVFFIPTALYFFIKNETLLKILITFEKVATKMPIPSVIAYGIIYYGNKTHTLPS